MFNNDYIRGYVEAIDHLSNTIDKLNRDLPGRFNDGLETDQSYSAKQEAYNGLLKYTQQVKENYKMLIKDLNASQSKKA